MPRKVMGGMPGQDLIRQRQTRACGVEAMQHMVTLSEEMVYCGSDCSMTSPTVSGRAGSGVQHTPSSTICIDQHSSNHVIVSQ